MMRMLELLMRPDLYLLAIVLIGLLIWLFVPRIEAVVVREHIC